MEPLASTRQLERFLLKMVAKQWFDHDRSTFTFIKKIKETSPITLNYQVRFKNFYFYIHFIVFSQLENFIKFTERF